MSEQFYNLKISEFYNSVEVKRYKKNISRKSEHEKEVERLEREEERKNNFVHFYIEPQEKEFSRSIDVSMKRTKQSIYRISRSVDWEFFVTFTFSPKKVDRSNYSAITKLLGNWLYRIKKAFAPDLIYLIVPEFHSDLVNYHFHGVFKNIGGLTFLDSGKKTKSGSIIYNLKEYNLGFSNCTVVNDTKRVSSYITKYITKELLTVTKGKKRFWSSRNIPKPSEEFLAVSDDDFETILHSIGNVSFSKSVLVPQAHNIVDIMQIDY